MNPSTLLWNRLKKTRLIALISPKTPEDCLKAFEILDPDSRHRVEALFAGELAGVGIIDVAKDRELETFLTRRVQLVTDPKGPSFRPTERLAIYSQ